MRKVHPGAGRKHLLVRPRPVAARVTAMPPRPRPMPCPPGRLRRSLDIVGGLILLVLLAPTFALISLAIRLTSPGPVLYLQTRVGINRRSGYDRRLRSARRVPWERRRSERRRIASAGRLFRIMKFRTMVDGAEALSGPTWAAENDERVTPLGRLLRRTRLDETPQVLNVLRGDMTFIGPRPERPFFVEKLGRAIPGYEQRLAVVPGLTGLAQVEHRYDASIDDVRRKLDYDLHYLRHRDWRLDVRIVWKTLHVVASGSGAR